MPPSSESDGVSSVSCCIIFMILNMQSLIWDSSALLWQSQASEDAAGWPSIHWRELSISNLANSNSSGVSASGNLYMFERRFTQKSSNDHRVYCAGDREEVTIAWREERRAVISVQAFRSSNSSVVSNSTCSQETLLLRMGSVQARRASSSSLVSHSTCSQET